MQPVLETFLKKSIFLVTPVVFGGASISVLAFATANNTKDGAYTAEQAERGQVVYQKSCAACHQANIHEVMARFENASVAKLFEVVSTGMPADNPSSLLSSEYVDALTYIFSITGSPSGSEELTMDNMEAVSVGPVK